MRSALDHDVAERFFTAEAERTARLCHAMSERFGAGGRLIATGHSPQARSDARHVAVEFVHPVIVGKRALPALALTAEGGPLEDQLAMIVEPEDMVIAFDGVMGAGTALRIEYPPASGGDTQWRFDPGADDAFVSQELVETHYHLLWELVHVFFEHRGRGDRGGAQDGGNAAFLYPFLGSRGGSGGRDHEEVVGDVAASVIMKAEEVARLRSQTLADGEATLAAAAATIRERFAAGGRLLALGNGGSATDAMDAVADCRFPPVAGVPVAGAAAGAPGTAAPPLTPRPALDLTEDTGILTAIANDIGVEAIFSRQVIAHGRAHDVLIAFSTSGNSVDVIHALAEARRRGLATIALVGYDGGRIASEELADFVVVTRSQHIPRIQEAQASAWHALREAIG
jgi:D-sedoheptulose 7-phosphate isomerase